MKLLITYIPFQVLLGVLLGIYFPVLNLYITCIVFFTVFIMMFLLHRSKMIKAVTHQLFFFFILLFGMSLSWCTQIIQQDFKYVNHYKSYINKEAFVKVTLVKQITTTQKNKRFYAQVNSINDTITSGKILVEIPINQAQAKNIDIGNVLLCKTHIQNIYPPVSPYDFNYRDYLAKQHVYAKINLEDNFIKTGDKLTWFIKLQKQRSYVNKKIEASVLSANTQSLIKAMLLGHRDSVTKEMQTSFTNAGVVHIIAISGMHVGVLYMMLLYTFRFLKKLQYGDYVYVLVILICLWAFAVFSGLSSSVIRSVTMFSFFTLTKLKSGKRLVLEAIITSMLILLLVDVNHLYNLGFQLSYAAVISIVVFYPLLSKWVKVKNKIAQYFIDVLIVSVIAQLGVLPLSSHYFHLIPLQFLLANFFAVSLLPVVLYAGILVVIKILVLTKQSFIELCYDEFITFYLDGIQYFSSFSDWILKDLYLLKVEIINYYVLLFCIWYLVDQFSYRRIKHSFALIIICQLFVLLNIYKSTNKDELIIYNTFNNIITLKTDKTLTVVSKDSLTVKDSILLKPNQFKNYIKTTKNVKSDVFSFKNETYILINKNQPYHLLDKKGLILILSNNPKINIERLLINLGPKQVIITSANYKSNQLKWKSTCKKLQVPFYCIADLGAYVEKN